MIYLARYAEIALKGKNRTDFEKKLIENIKTQLKPEAGYLKISRLPGRLLLESEGEADLRRFFGLVSYSPCIKINVALKDICSKALSLAKNHDKTSTFRISAKRLTKLHPSTSVELNKKIGAFIVEKLGLKVDLENPGFDIGVEIIGDSAFIFEKTIPCVGGLPAGVEGKVLCLISNAAHDASTFAAFLMMKRGCAIEITGSSELDFSLLQHFSPNKLIFHKIKGLFELHELANKLHCRALVVPDTLNSLKDYSTDMLVLRPLVAFYEKEISELSVMLEKDKSNRSLF